ncbi:MAG: tandem-95 repeat protein, partial [Actinomycetota bacterium]|nr:tandem-95 repeat protein [Actinomycetota bacterium]
PLPITLAGTDIDGETPAITYTQPTNGSYDGATYTPALNYYGSDSFTYTATDAAGLSDTATVTITVRPVNDAPEAADRTVATDEDTPLPITLAGTDIDGETPAITYTQPTNGSYDGTTYTPALNYNGSDSFTYTATDAAGLSDTATVTITVHPVNDAPEVTDRAVETDEDVPVPITLAGTDVENDPLSFSWSDPPHGTFDGARYTPDPNYYGLDSFEYTADDGNGGTDTATVTITVRPVNEPPTVTLAGPAATDEGAAPVTFAASASDPDGADTLTYTWSVGSGTLAPAGANAAYSNDDGPRTDTVTVTVSDGTASATASAEILVRNVSPTSAAGADVTEFWGLPYLFAATATDPSAADTAAGLAGQWAFGDASLPASGFTAAHAYAQPGPYTATFTATDKDGGSGTDSVAVTIAKRPTSLAYTGPNVAVFGLLTLTASLSDTIDAPTADLAGRQIVFRLGSRTFTATTDSAGVATVNSVLPLTSGELTLEFAGDTRYLPSSTRAALTIESGPGKITGGGLRSLTHSGRGGFNVHSSTKGELQWQSNVLNFHAPDITGLGVAPDGRTAWFAGVDRDGRPYVAYVEDNGEPGRNDIFKLWIAGVLQTSGDGRLSGGNIQIHKN